MAAGETPGAPGESGQLEPPFTKEKIQAFLEQRPVLFVLVGLLALMAPPTQGPAWRKDLPPVGGRVAGPWRGKGSFGHGFGPQAGHR